MIITTRSPPFVLLILSIDEGTLIKVLVMMILRILFVFFTIFSRNYLTALLCLLKARLAKDCFSYWQIIMIINLVDCPNHNDKEKCPETPNNSMSVVFIQRCENLAANSFSETVPSLLTTSHHRHILITLPTVNNSTKVLRLNQLQWQLHEGTFLL